MNCPRCQKYIVPDFYCINCGHVPPKIQKPDPNKAEIPLNLTAE
jgi:hypothetical protein